MASTKRDELLDPNQIIEEFGISRSRISELYRDREVTGFPEADEVDGRRRSWKRHKIETFVKDHQHAKEQLTTVRPSLLKGDPDELLSTSEVSKILGHKRTATVLGWLKLSPGYFPEPDVTERTDGGRLRRKWRRGTIADWIANRPGPGNTRSKTREKNTVTPVAEGDPEELLDAKQAAALLGYSSHLHFNRAIARGILPELAEPDEATAGARLTTNRWKRRRVVELAQARQEAPSSAELKQRRLDAALEALRAAATGQDTVMVEHLARAHPGLGSATAWKNSIDEARRHLQSGG